MTPRRSPTGISARVPSDGFYAHATPFGFPILRGTPRQRAIPFTMTVELIKILCLVTAVFAMEGKYGDFSVCLSDALRGVRYARFALQVFSRSDWGLTDLVS